MNRRPRWGDVPGLLIDLGMAAALIASIAWAGWVLARLSE